MKPLLLTILISFLIVLPAPAQDNQTKEDIKMQYGEPFWRGEGEQREVWYYPHKRMFIYFEGDKVVEIDIITGESGHI